jgi:hypothetical protein
VTSLTAGGIRLARDTDLRPQFLTPKYYREFVDKPYAPDLSMLFVHDNPWDETLQSPSPSDDGTSFAAKYDRRLTRLLALVREPPEEGVHLIYHVQKEAFLEAEAFDTNTQEANAQELKAMFHGRDRVQVSTLTEALPTLTTWCLEFFQRQQRLYLVMLSQGIPVHEYWLGSGSLEEKAGNLRNLISDRSRNTCNWLTDPVSVATWISLWSE